MRSNLRIAFRVDGGECGIGMGHITRCVALAEAFQKSGGRCFFISRELSAGIQFIREQGYEVHTLPQTLSAHDDLVGTLSHAESADVVVVDLYQAPTEYLEGLRQSGKLVVSFDDLMDKSLPVDIVIGRIDASRKDYGDLLDAETLLLAGPQYIPLRQQFRNLHPKKINSHLTKVLVACGGEDPQNVTLKIVEALFDYPKKLHLEILLGIAYAFQAELQTVLSHCPHTYQIERNVRHVLTRFQEADIALTAAGTTIWELAASGTPFVAFQIADNQKSTINFLKEKQLGYVLDDISPETVVRALQALESQPVREKYSSRCQSIIDGRGAERIVEAITHFKEDSIALRQLQGGANGRDSKLIWQWRNDPMTQKMSRDGQTIPWSSHLTWLKQILHHSQSTLLIAYEHETPIGMVRLDRRSSKQAEININLDPEKRGKGYGKRVLKYACEYVGASLDYTELYAEIKPENSSSIQIFEDVGFIFQGMKNGLRTYLYPIRRKHESTNNKHTD